MLNFPIARTTGASSLLRSGTAFSLCDPRRSLTRRQDGRKEKSKEGKGSQEVILEREEEREEGEPQVFGQEAETERRFHGSNDAELATQQRRRLEPAPTH